MRGNPAAQLSPLFSPKERQNQQDSRESNDARPDAQEQKRFPSLLGNVVKRAGTVHRLHRDLARDQADAEILVIRVGRHVFVSGHIPHAGVAAVKTVPVDIDCHPVLFDGDGFTVEDQPEIISLRQLAFVKVFVLRVVGIGGPIGSRPHLIQQVPRRIRV